MMIHREGYARLFRLILAAVCALALLTPLLIAGNNKALGEHQIAIRSPKSGSVIRTASFTITVDYSVDYGYVKAPSPGQSLSLLFKGVSQTGGPSWLDTRQPASGGSGTVSITASAPAGVHTLTVILQAEGYGTVTYTAVDFVVDLSGAAVVPGSDTTDGSTDGGSGTIFAILGGAALVIGGLVMRGFVKKGKGKAVQKTTGPKYVYKEAETVEEAARRLAEVKKNKALLDRFNKIRDIVWSDDRLLDFVDSARGTVIGPNSQVDAEKLARLENTLKYWIARDKLAPQMPDYGGTEFYYDTVYQASHSLIIRGGMAWLTAGYSEIALNPVAAVSNMRENINAGDSTGWAVAKGLGWSAFELGLGESGRLVKYAKPYITNLKESYHLSRLAKTNPELSAELSTINQLAKQGHTGRDAFMRSSEVVNAGKTAAANLDHAERLALQLNNNPEFRKLLAENSKVLPSRVKEVMGAAKQKVYENARNNAIEDVMKQMSKEGVPAGESPLFLQQTGTHAKPGNPAWDSFKSDFDHTVDFGSAERNALYEARFNAHLEAQGTNATAIDANVYGPGTSARGSYSGGAMRFVENYNQTNGSQVMIRVKDGVTTISREEPQVIDSLLSKMKPEDVASAKSNYQEFFQKSLQKGGTVDNMIKNSSKEVSRTAGQYSVKYVEHFQKTGRVNYPVPKAAKVADLIKKRGFTVDGAMQKVGYGGSKEQLLAEFKEIMVGK